MIGNLNVLFYLFLVDELGDLMLILALTSSPNFVHDLSVSFYISLVRGA
jgi:hypothetical protein